ncbi:MAG: hypothetical protein Tsb0018_09370 [Opitutales bacterium]
MLRFDSIFKNVYTHMLFIILGFLAVGFFIFLVSYIAISFEVDRALNLYAEHSSVPIDIVFVVAEKDVETLSYSVNSVKKWVKHPLIRWLLLLGLLLVFKT